MNDEESHLRDYLRIILKWRWLILASFVLIVLGAALHSFRQVPIYRGTARILIERTSPNITSFADPGAMSSSYWDPQFIETQVNIIKSSAVAERMLQNPMVRSLFAPTAAPVSDSPSLPAQKGMVETLERRIVRLESRIV